MMKWATRTALKTPPTHGLSINSTAQQYATAPHPPPHSIDANSGRQDVAHKPPPDDPGAVGQRQRQDGQQLGALQRRVDRRLVRQPCGL